MTKLTYNKIKGYLPLTIQNAKIIDRITPEFKKGIIASDYQSDNVNQQQFFKPISKILQF